MIHEYLKLHPDSGKVIVYTEAYLQMRLMLIKQIANIENSIEDTSLSNDADIRQKLLPSLKRTLKGLDRRFLRAGGYQDPVYCARLIEEFEWEQIKEPLLYCRYYDGKTDTQGGNVHLFAKYEKMWCEYQHTKNDAQLYRNSIAEYIYNGLMMFADYDKAPISLKALLFNRYCHWQYGGANEFKYWYDNTYRAEAIR